MWPSSGITSITVAVVFALVFAFASGCKGVQSRLLEDSKPCTRMGATITLPKGKWRVETAPDTGNVTVFRSQDRPGSVAFIRVNAAGDRPAWLSLQDLFVEFRDKHELKRWTRKTRRGYLSHGVTVLMYVDGRSVHATAYAVRRDLWTYEVVAWGFGRGQKASARIAEAVIDTIAFPDVKSKK